MAPPQCPGMDPNNEHAFVFYRYSPNLAAAIIFIIVFFGTTGYHGWQMFSKRAWSMIPFFIGGLFESVGYIGRALSNNDPCTLGPYIIQTLLLLIAPALFAASVYMILGRIILLVDGEEYALISKKWLTKFFVTGDVISFAMQAAGGGIMASGTLTAMETGEKIIIAGLCLQLVWFGFFVVVASMFHSRFNKSGRSPAVPWQKYMVAIYVVSVLIFVRSVFRVIEYAMGNAGYLLRHEIFLYIFDALLMAAVMIILNVIHPGEITRLLKSGSAGHSQLQMEEGAIGGQYSYGNRK